MGDLPMSKRSVWVAGVVGLVAGMWAAADGPDPGPKAPAYQRTLKGDDAKKAADLAQRIAKLEAAGKPAEALEAA